MIGRIINAPRPETVQMLERKMSAEARALLRETTFNAVGLVQLSIPDLYFFADLVMKTSPVLSVELHGTCPQHVTTLAFFGETSAVRMAMNAIESSKESCK